MGENLKVVLVRKVSVFESLRDLTLKLRLTPALLVRLSWAKLGLSGWMEGSNTSGNIGC